MSALRLIPFALLLFGALACSAEREEIPIAQADPLRLAALSSALLADLNRTLATIHEPWSADAARPHLEDLVERMGEIAARRRELQAADVAGAGAAPGNQLGVTGQWQRLRMEIQRLRFAPGVWEPIERPLLQLEELMEPTPELDEFTQKP